MTQQLTNQFTCSLTARKKGSYSGPRRRATVERSQPLPPGGAQEAARSLLCLVAVGWGTPKAVPPQVMAGEVGRLDMLPELLSRDRVICVSSRSEVNRNQDESAEFASEYEG